MFSVFTWNIHAHIDCDSPPPWEKKKTPHLHPQHFPLGNLDPKSMSSSKCLSDLTDFSLILQ